ncbi:unnamed protein product [Rotaria sp. Silwood1]|nr:unnamed protein product [Rotaria sp. Silwood1]CAF1136398.1 unnamed protein product [Rotaria sp. Silwood1]CAF4846061.1 unnamed protein product [Rotaria sp. Silwood1]
MKKRLLIAIFILVACQLSLMLTHQYFGYQLKKSDMSNLTSLMIPFEQMTRNSTFCCSDVTLQEQYKMEFQQLEHYHLGQFYEQPTIHKHSKQHIASTLPELPYFYSLWKTSPILPRLITPCEHQVYVKLMKTFDEICQANGIEYMISYSTLLGSYRNHDILPYDDDVDVLIHVKYYSLLSKMNALYNKADWKFYLRTPTFMKFYFQASSFAGVFRWKWPFIDIFFYTDNSTHIKSDIYIEKDIIFPLLLRPIATLWLPGPRNALRFFKKISEYYYSNLSFDDKCYLQKYSHRDEEEKYEQKVVNCAQLHNVYPYIQRICDNDYCNEYFMLNDITTLYVLKMTKDK